MTTLAHGNTFAHRMLTDQGAFVHTHHPEDFEDIGDAENGPQLVGSPAFDEYSGDSHEIIMDHTGAVVCVSEIDWDQYRFYQSMEELPDDYGDEPEYVRPRRAGEDYKVKFRDEDGDWYACHPGWTTDPNEAHFFTEAAAKQIAHQFNITPTDRMAGIAHPVFSP